MSSIDGVASETRKSTGKVYDKAIQLLKLRPHHSGELRKKLSMRDFSGSDISDVISRLANQGLLDDQAFGLNYLQSLCRYKTYGYYGIKAKLMSRGVASNEAEKLLRENFSLEQETGIAQRLVSKLGNFERIKLAQKLSRKGFRSQVISEILGNFSGNVV